MFQSQSAQTLAAGRLSASPVPACWETHAFSQALKNCFQRWGDLRLFLGTWVTFDDIHQHTCMLYPGPGCDMSRVVLEVTTFGMGASGAHEMCVFGE